MGVIKSRILLILIGLIFITSCGRDDFNEQHERYLSKRGWVIKETLEVKTYTLEIPEELLDQYEASGITFMKDHLGEEVTEYYYELKEKDVEGNHLKAVVFGQENKIIGSFGLLPSWSPGRFILEEKERLVTKQMIKK